MTKQFKRLAALMLSAALWFSCGGSPNAETAKVTQGAQASQVSIAKESQIEVLAGAELMSEPAVPLYDIWRLKMAPGMNKTLELNPPKFQWRMSEAKDARYIVELTQDASFQTGIIYSPELPYCFFNLNNSLANGKWFWRIKTLSNSKIETSVVSSFFIDAGTPVDVYPGIDEVISNIPKFRPFLLSYGQPIARVLKNAESLPKKKAVVVDAAVKSLTKAIIDFEVK